MKNTFRNRQAALSWASEFLKSCINLWKRFRSRPVAVLWAYRISLAVAMISVFLPWATLTGSATAGSESYSQGVSISGLFICWSWFILLVALVAGTFSFLAPKSTVLSILSGLIAVLGLLAIGTISVFARFFGSAYSDAGVNASSEISASIGVYLVVLAGCAGAVFGWFYSPD